MLHAPSLLAGHPGSDHFSGALLHDQTWAVQTLSKVKLMNSPVWKHHLCLICIWFVMQAFVCQWELREVIQGRDQPHQQHIHQIRVWHRDRPWELWESMSLPHWVTTELQFYILSIWVPQFQCWTPACRWSWMERCPEVRALGSLSPMTLERVSPTRPFPLSRSCRSHTTLRTPTYCWSSATMWVVNVEELRLVWRAECLRLKHRWEAVLKQYGRPF